MRFLHRSRLLATTTLTAALALGFLAACGTSERPERATEKASRATDLGYDEGALRRDVEAIGATGVTGVQARVVLDDGSALVAASGVSDTTTKQPVSPEGHFRIGSVNKTFVATVVLQLVAEGRLALDDTVESRLPGVVRGHGHDGRTITLQHLLQHTAGVYDGAFLTFDGAEGYHEHRYDVRTPQETVARAMRHEPDFPPGDDWSYSNTGYVILGMVIERVTGRPWYEEVTGRIIEPLDLTQTSWPGTSPSIPEPHAKGYDRYEPTGSLVDVTQLVDADASGGLISTTADLNRFFRALLGGELLAPEQLKQMQKTVPVSEELQLAVPDAGYGLGLMSRPLSCGGTFWFHGGDQNGYSTVNGVSAGGRRSVVVSISTQFFDSMESALRPHEAARTLLDNALCGKG